jgi:hypothetical protein
VTKAGGAASFLNGGDAPVIFDGSEAVLELEEGEAWISRGGKVSQIKLTGRGGIGDGGSKIVEWRRPPAVGVDKRAIGSQKGEVKHSQRSVSHGERQATQGVRRRPLI